MRRGASGKYVAGPTVGGEQVVAFLPDPLPPRVPIEVAPGLREKLDGALLALGRLDSVSTILPDSNLFIYSYVRKEAVLSSQIEGTQSTLSDLLLFEMQGATGAPAADVTEVSNYVRALEHGLARVRSGFPLSTRLLREIHEKLLASGRGSDHQPGEFRRSQNWIGGTRPGNALFVPPPAELVAECMSDLERWLHDLPERTPALVKAALGHVQFETIHPFLDGNGRVGRLLITLLLCVEGILQQPLLYLSLYLKRNRSTYYALLDDVRREGDWERWLEFFVDGVRETADGAVNTARRLWQRTVEDEARIRELGRVSGSALRVHGALKARPMGTTTSLVADTGLTFTAVSDALARLQSLSVVREVTGRRRNRVYTYAPYLAILAEGTEEPLDAQRR